VDAKCEQLNSWYVAFIDSQHCERSMMPNGTEFEQVHSGLCITAAGCYWHNIRSLWCDSAVGTKP